MKQPAFLTFAELCESLEHTKSRKKKTDLVSSFLRQVPPEAAEPSAVLLVGLPSEEKSKAPLDVGWATISDALEAQARPLEEAPLTVADVWSGLRRIPHLKGPGSKARKKAVLQALLSRSSSIERKWLLRCLFGEMRHGVNRGIMLSALASLAGVEEEAVRRADMLVGDLGRLAALAVSGKLRQTGLVLFSPVRPMLAEMCGSINEALKSHGGTSGFEPKLDGVRIQAHLSGGEVRVFTRRLSDITRSVPDVVELIRRHVACTSAVLDGEVVGIDPSGRSLPFQETMRRIGREREIDETAREVPLKLYLFDILYLDGEELFDKPYAERRRLLEQHAPASILTDRLVSGSADEVAAFMKKALDEGHEGLMAKALSSPYTPGQRGGRWLKIKPADLVDAVILAAEWGSGRRQGWLSNYHLGVLDEDTKEFVMVGKTFKGLTDAEFGEMTQRLQLLKTEEKEWGVVVRPELVVEVAYNEIQRSPHYPSGFALRFARITRIREDKPAGEADTLQKLRRLYEVQFHRKGRPSPT